MAPIAAHGYAPDRGRGLIPGLALPDPRAGAAKRGPFSPIAPESLLDSLAEGDRGFESGFLQRGDGMGQAARKWHHRRCNRTDGVP